MTNQLHAIREYFSYDNASVSVVLLLPFMNYVAIFETKFLGRNKISFIHNRRIMTKHSIALAQGSQTCRPLVARQRCKCGPQLSFKPTKFEI
jgi:hypothetical protein